MNCGDTVAPLQVFFKDREINGQQGEVKKEKSCSITFGDWNAIDYSLLRKWLHDRKYYDSILSREISNLWAAKWRPWNRKGGVVHVTSF